MATTLKFSDEELAALNDRKAYSASARQATTSVGTTLTEITFFTSRYDEALLAKLASQTKFHCSQNLEPGSALDIMARFDMDALHYDPNDRASITAFSRDAAGTEYGISIKYTDTECSVIITDPRMLRALAEAGIVFPGSEILKGADDKGKGLPSVG